MSQQPQTAAQNPDPQAQPPAEQQAKNAANATLLELQMLLGMVRKTIAKDPNFAQKLQKAAEDLEPARPAGESDLQINYDLSLTKHDGVVVHLKGSTPLHLALVPTRLPSLTTNVEAAMGTLILVPLNTAVLRLVDAAADVLSPRQHMLTAGADDQDDGLDADDDLADP